MKKDKKKKEFSKFLLTQESILIWIVTLSFIGLAFYCVHNQYFGELPWLAAMCGFPWTAYGVSQACYYRKAQRENMKGGIKYDTTMYGLGAEGYAMPEETDVYNEEGAIG